MMARIPFHGFTKRGRAVHARTIDHLPENTLYQRFNKRLALALTKSVGTMTCFWVFCAIAFTSLPATLVIAGVITFHSVIASIGFVYVVQWAAQSFLQLILLPALMVGQNLQNEAADARVAKTFEDTEQIKNDMLKALDQLDTNTEGGLKEILDAIKGIETREGNAQKPV